MSIRERLFFQSSMLVFLVSLQFTAYDAGAAEKETAGKTVFPTNKVVRVEYRGGGLASGQTTFFLSTNAVKVIANGDIEAIAFAPKWDALFVNSREKLYAEIPHDVWQKVGFGGAVSCDNLSRASIAEEHKATYLGLPVVVSSYRVLRRDSAFYKSRSGPEMCVLQRYESASLPHLQEQLDFIGKWVGCANLKGIPLVSRYKTRKGDEYILEAIGAELVPSPTVTFKLSSTGFKRVADMTKLMHYNYDPMIDALK